MKRFLVIGFRCLLVILVIFSIVYSNTRTAKRKSYSPDNQEVRIDTTIVTDEEYSGQSGSAYVFTESDTSTLGTAVESVVEYNPSITSEETTVEQSSDTNLVITSAMVESMLYEDFDLYIQEGYISQELADTFINSDYITNIERVYVEFNGVSDSGNDYAFLYSLNCDSEFYSKEIGVLRVTVEDGEITYIHKFVTETY